MVKIDFFWLADVCLHLVLPVRQKRREESTADEEDDEGATGERKELGGVGGRAAKVLTTVDLVSAFRRGQLVGCRGCHDGRPNWLAKAMAGEVICRLSSAVASYCQVYYSLSLESGRLDPAFGLPQLRVVGEFVAFFGWNLIPGYPDRRGGASALQHQSVARRRNSVGFNNVLNVVNLVVWVLHDRRPDSSSSLPATGRREVPALWLVRGEMLKSYLSLDNWCQM
ncbi:probable cationic amino acid transporter [Lates japonicus]|uniref:Probable cationic amino acid transporter n=1 Tax=Lates japonicus TaxID=270547 RepID=A0AAD3RMK5_LATJO|nr:probable cationic amino acid transporter [Lates japonicus]